MSENPKEMIVRRPKFMFGEPRQYFYSDNSQFPRFRILLTQNEANDSLEFWNACIEFANAFQYHELTRSQRNLKMLVSFHGATHNSGIGHGIALLEDDGIGLDELLQAFMEVGAEPQREIIARYEETLDAPLSREYYRCQPDVLKLAIAYARQNFEQFIKLT